MSDYIKQHAINLDYHTGESWIILNEIEQSIKKKIEAAGTPLKDWNISINYGIKTGLNEAFIISKEKRDELVEADPKSAEIIRPILRGRDIKKNSYEFANIYVITAYKGINKIIKNEYPAIYLHLKKYEKKLRQRGQVDGKPGKPGSNQHHWTELDNNVSLEKLDDLNSPKVVWNRIASKKVFGLVPPEFVVQDSVHFITGEHLKYLTAILNSKLFSWLMTIIIGDAAGGNAGNASNVKDLTIIKPTENIINKISRLLEEHDTKEIDKIIYNLYALTDEEIRLVSSFK